MNRYEGGCTTVVIGRKASATGHVLIGHNEDDDKSIVMVHSVPHQKHDDKDRDREDPPQGQFIRQIHISLPQRSYSEELFI